jgi:hypothetical protein
LSEAEYLARQADEARRAIAHALNEAKASLAQGMDPKEWTRRYPKIAVGSAIVAGFAAAVLAIPSKEQQELRRLERLHRAMNPPPPEPAKPHGEEKTKTEKSKSVWSIILLEAVQLIRPVVTSALNAALAAHRNGAPDGDGRVEDQPPPVPNTANDSQHA